MSIKRTGGGIVEEFGWGVYVWKLPTGEVLGDGDGNFMLIKSTKGDIAKMAKIRDAAKSYGYEEGEPEFWSGVRPISESEYSEQLDRMTQGLIPDELDPGVYKDHLEEQRNK